MVRVSWPSNLGELPLPDIEPGHLLGEMLEQPGVMGERENDGDGEAVGGRKRPRAALAGGRRRRLCRSGVPLASPRATEPNSLDLTSRR